MNSGTQKKTVAIVQARMGSSRLPGKTLMSLAGQPLLGHVIDRLKQCRKIDEIVVATTSLPEDDAIEKFVAQKEVQTFRGDPVDVLDRYYQAAKQFESQAVVRITGDCPLLDPKVIDRVVAKFFRAGVNYASNTLRYTYPEGLDVEVFDFTSLEKAWKEARSVCEREHVTPFLRTHPEVQKLNVEREEDLSYLGYDWSVDREEDFRFVTAVLESLPNGSVKSFDHEAVVELLSKKPELATMLASRIHNEGYYLTMVRETSKSPVRQRSLAESEKWLSRSEKVIPLATQTFSKAANQFVRGVAPVFLERGEGARVWDVDGNEYIDYIMALCPVILGYADSKVDAAVRRQMSKGVSFSLPHPLEVELAEKLTQLIPCAEMVRFGKNGSDATSAAVRAARAYTGREIIACSGYHGWQDWYIGSTLRHFGVPQAVRDLTKTFQYNDPESLEKIFAQHPGQVAAVVLEPMGVEEPRDGFLQKVQDLAKKNGALLVFDEIVTGFRWSLGGAQKYFGVTPDLGCFGKAMANGYPISAVVGKREIMTIFEKIFYSGTFGGETLSLAASLETIHQLEKRKAIPRIWSQGRKLIDGVNVFVREFGLTGKVKCLGLPPRSEIRFLGSNEEESRLWKSLFQQEVLKRGILFSGAQNVSDSHGDREIEETLLAYRDAFEILAAALRSNNVAQKLEGKPLEAVFRRL